jgi:transposase
MNARRTRRNYTKEFKADAVGLVVEQGYSSAEVGRRLGVSENNVNRWVRQYRDKKAIASTDGLTREQLEAELKRLRKENKRLEMEREILKKAAAFFANESK